MIIPGSIILCALILALIGSTGADPAFRTNIPSTYPLSRLTSQDGYKADDGRSAHRYTPSSVWTACGVIPYEGYEGWVNQEGQAWKGDDGAMVYLVEDSHTSPLAAEAERIARLTKKSPKPKPWPIAQIESLDGITIIKLAEPVQVGPEEDSSSQWVVMWVRGSSLFLIYGPDREHVLDYYRAHARGYTKK